MIVGCYTMDLYCKYASTSNGPDAGKRHRMFGDRGFLSLSGDTRSGCVKQAIKRGWKFTAGDVTCKKCLLEGLK